MHHISKMLYFTKNEHHSYDIMDTGLKIHFENVTESETHMYFTDDYENFINVPNGIIVYRYGLFPNEMLKVIHNITVPKPSPDANNRRLITTYANNYYILNSKHRYDIQYHNRNVLCLEPQNCLKFVNYQCVNYKRHI